MKYLYLSVGILALTHSLQAMECGETEKSIANHRGNNDQPKTQNLPTDDYEEICLQGGSQSTGSPSDLGENSDPNDLVLVENTTCYGLLPPQKAVTASVNKGYEEVNFDDTPRRQKVHLKSQKSYSSDYAEVWLQGDSQSTGSPSDLAENSDPNDLVLVENSDCYGTWTHQETAHTSANDDYEEVKIYDTPRAQNDTPRAQNEIPYAKIPSGSNAKKSKKSPHTDYEEIVIVNENNNTSKTSASLNSSQSPLSAGTSAALTPRPNPLSKNYISLNQTKTKLATNCDCTYWLNSGGLHSEDAESVSYDQLQKFIAGKKLLPYVQKPDDQNLIFYIKGATLLPQSSESKDAALQTALEVAVKKVHKSYAQEQTATQSQADGTDNTSTTSSQTQSPNQSGSSENLLDFSTDDEGSTPPSGTLKKSKSTKSLDRLLKTFRLNRQHNNSTPNLHAVQAAAPKARTKGVWERLKAKVSGNKS